MFYQFKLGTVISQTAMNYLQRRVTLARMNVDHA